MVMRLALESSNGGIVRVGKFGPRTFIPLNANRPPVRKLRGELAKIIARFLRAQARDMAEQIARLRARYGKALTPDEQDTVERILAQLDFSGWAVLAGEVDGILQAIAEDSAYAALLQVGIDTEARADVVNIVNEFALDYAQDRSAEMVGMRRTELGGLEINPNAEWQITETTRVGVRATVEDALAEGWSNDALGVALADAFTFSNDRALVIARTETQLANNEGALAGYKASGVVDGKQWLTADDDKVSEDCDENGSAGPNADGVLFDLDAAFPSGDAAPPAHPNCRCSIVPYIAFENATEQENPE